MCSNARKIVIAIFKEPGCSILCCVIRTNLNTSDYWFGLYKLSPLPGATTMWYDGNPSTYRSWDAGEPNEETTCVRYTSGGFRDRNCSWSFYYTCKKSAGNSVLISGSEGHSFYFKLIHKSQ